MVKGAYPMTSDVFIASMRARSAEESTVNKIRMLFERADLSNVIKKGDLTAIKVHFGERGCDAFISPVHVRQVVDKVKNAGGKPFITDSNTLYSGSRHDSVDHLENAIEHGFDYAVVRAPLIIADGLKGKNVRWVKIAGKHFEKVRIAADIAEADSMMVLTHFKGHEMAGFGGAIKNLAMGCASAYGKMDQHSVRPKVVTGKCIGCGKCAEICPVGAPSIEGGKCTIVREKCIGCGECITVCPVQAVGLDWSSEIRPFMEKMVEYAHGAALTKQGKVGYMNFVTRVSPVCDCYSWSDHPIVPDVGILASKDPVALDRACYDLVNKQPGFKDSQLKKGHEPGGDKFLGLRPKVDPRLQLDYAEELGMGTNDYKLIEL